VAELLGVDPACLTVWRYRGIGPAPEPRYFKGSVQVYRLDRVQAWLAARQGDAYDVEQAWADALLASWEPMPGLSVREQVRAVVQLLGAD
jgi:hypothetical protein